MTAISTLSETDLCNGALSKLGISSTINSINPPNQTAEAQACAFWYAKTRDRLLKSAPWDFAYTCIALASDSSVFPGWKYAYQFPNDCLQSIAVTTAAGQRFGNIFWGGYWGFSYLGASAIPKIPFKVVQSQKVTGQKAILCDLPSPAYLFYIQCVADTALFDPLFQEAFEWELAAKIGGPLRLNVQKVQQAATMGASTRLEAMAQAMNEAQQDPARESPSVLVRW